MFSYLYRLRWMVIDPQRPMHGIFIHFTCESTVLRNKGLIFYEIFRSFQENTPAWVEGGESKGQVTFYM